MLLHEDRLLPVEATTRQIAKQLYAEIKTSPIISPHGHTDPRWFAEDAAFDNPVSLFLQPDHYLYRMLYSQGITLEQIGLSGKGKIGITNNVVETNKRKIWRMFSEHYHLFRGTPSRIWLDHSLYEICGIEKPLNAENADAIYDELLEKLKTPQFRPRALFKHFNIELLATTESPLDDLRHHDILADTLLAGKIITTYRPDPIVDPEFESFLSNLKKFSEITKTDISSFSGYLEAHRRRRQDFIKRGATATDHGHPTAFTANLTTVEAEKLYQKVLQGGSSKADAELFRGQMITEMAKLSLEDGLVLQFHVGSLRNHNHLIFQKFGRDRGADIPMRTDFVHGLKSLLDVVGNESKLTIILFTLDESTYSRELATLAGHYPCLKVGPAWWFHDSIEGMRRYKQCVIETAGFYNIAGFNDDTRAFLSIPARHDLARRIDCGYLANLVREHQITEIEAIELAHTLTTGLVKQCYHLK